jgi:TrmH family RNA methyltransferase
MRRKHQLFMVEGKKMVEEAVKSDWSVEALIVSTDFAPQFVSVPLSSPTYLAESGDFKKISQQTNPEGIIAVIRFPNPDYTTSINLSHLPPGPGFILDAIQDPGNLGTIMRIADWFGFPYLICGSGTADVLNPKTLRSSMGAIFRVKILNIDNLLEIVRQEKNRIKIADMKGESPTKLNWSTQDFILIGNEANGIPEAIRQIPDLTFVSIPGNGQAESLNAAVSAGILGYELYNNLS